MPRLEAGAGSGQPIGTALAASPWQTALQESACQGRFSQAIAAPARHPR